MAIVPNGCPEVGRILAAKYFYGDEILTWKFYIVRGYTAKRVKIQELKTITTYDDGLKGPHYYDAPKHIQPVIVDGYVTTCGDIKNISYKLLSDGTFCVHPEPYYTSYGVWNGEPLEKYNLH